MDDILACAFLTQFGTRFYRKQVVFKVCFFRVRVIQLGLQFENCLDPVSDSISDLIKYTQHFQNMLYLWFVILVLKLLFTL